MFDFAVRREVFAVVAILVMAACAWWFTSMTGLFPR